MICIPPLNDRLTSKYIAVELSSTVYNQAGKAVVRIRDPASTHHRAWHQSSKCSIPEVSITETSRSLQTSFLSARSGPACLLIHKLPIQNPPLGKSIASTPRFHMKNIMLGTSHMDTILYSTSLMISYLEPYGQRSDTQLINNLLHTVMLG